MASQEGARGSRPREDLGGLRGSGSGRCLRRPLACCNAACCDPEMERTRTFLGRFSAAGTLIQISRDPESPALTIDTDEPSAAGPIDVASLPSFLRELAEGLRDGETASFLVKPGGNDGQQPSVRIVSIPDHLRAKLGTHSKR